MQNAECNILHSAFCILHSSLLAATLVLLGGCGQLRELPTAPIDSDLPDPAATFTRIQNEIFTPTCSVFGCHDPETMQAGMTLVAGRSYGMIVGRPSSERPQLLRIAPGDPASSYLYLKITGAPGIDGDRMPQGQLPLPDAQIRLIRDWIRRGAPND